MKNGALKFQSLFLFSLLLSLFTFNFCFAFEGDITGDGYVDFADLSVMASEWLDSGCNVSGCSGADIDGSDVVDMKDFSLLAHNWNKYEPGLLAWYRFNETSGTTVIDYSGKANNARVTNSSSWNATGFNGKGCLYFNGTFNVRVPETVYSNIDKTVTVSLWVNSDNPGTYSNALFYGVDSSNTRVLGVELPGGDNLHLWFNAGSSGTNYDMYPYWNIASAVTYRGNWNHYAFTKDAGTGLMKIYINGSLLGTETNKTMSMDKMTNFVIGSACDNISWKFQGKMADFRIYNSVLGATEIKDLADANLLGWWTFDEGTGTKAYDQTANRNDGTKGTADSWIEGGIDFYGSGTSGISFASSGLNIVKDLTTQVTISYLTTWDSFPTHTTYPYDGRDSSNNRLLSAEFPTGTHALIHNGGDSMWCWEAFNDQDNRFIFSRVGKTWGDYIRITSTADFGTGEWKLYIDDYLYISQTGKIGSFANLVKFYIGQTYSGTNEMEGSIKDFRIYSKVLSDSEIAILNTPLIASDPIPADGAIAPATEDGNVTLYWKPGLNTNATNGHRVYFGTNYDAVNNAALTSAAYKGTQTANSYNLSSLSENTTYYWRIDEVAGSEVCKGDVYSFTISDVWLMDFVYTGNLSTADRICAYTIQGLMNQKGARVLFDVAGHNAGNSTADDYWVGYLQNEKGVTFAKIGSLRELVAAARNEGVISGLTKYTPANIDSGEVTIAVNLAVDSNYVPVTTEMLNYTSAGLKYKGYINCFDGLTINDISGTWATKLAAQSYGVTNLMPGTPTDGVFSCIRSFPTFDDGHNYDNGIDYGIQRKFYAYDMNYSNTGTERTLFNNVMSHLVKPGMSFGSWHDEGIDLEGISAAGNYTVLCGFNLSFWANVDYNPANLNMSRPTSGMTLDNTKYYVMFQSSEGDTAGYLTGLQMSGVWEGAGGSWLKANRNKGKVTWCTVPVAYDLWPALLEYYNTHCEPNDSFWTGPSGAGYNRPSSLPNLAAWAALTDSYIADLSIQGVECWWGYSLSMYETFKANAPHIKCFSHQGTDGGSNAWLSDGTPVIQSHCPVDRTQGMWYAELHANPAQMVTNITNFAATKTPPYFITVYDTPACIVDYASICEDQLGPNFVIVRGVDFVDLMTQAGANKAKSPNPSNGATGVSRSVHPAWTAGVNAISHLVYFGTDSTPDETEYKGELTTTSYNPGSLSMYTYYYWRIDEKNSLGQITTGNVWSFRTGF